MTPGSISIKEFEFKTKKKFDKIEICIIQLSGDTFKSMIRTMNMMKKG
jgi:hypothetical protein